MKLAERFFKARSKDTFLYFAFGSNLSSHRIRVNNPSAKYVSTALLKGYRLTFNFHSSRWRGSPATIVQTDDDVEDSGVHGVLWELDFDHLPTLDDQEGVARQVYERIMVSVLPRDSEKGSFDEEPVEVFTYRLCSQRCTLAEEDAKPSLAYKQVILRGAHEHRLPEDYLAKLAAIKDNGDDGHVDLKKAVAQLEFSEEKD